MSKSKNRSAEKSVEVSLGGKLVGTVSKTPAGVMFSYAGGWLEHGFEVSPVNWPRRVQPYAPNTRKTCFKGLPGFLWDSLPDAFGNKLIMNEFAKRNLGEPDGLDLLSVVGRHGMGALRFSPVNEWDTDTEAALSGIELGRLSKHAHEVLDGLNGGKLARVLFENGSPIGGARPKMCVAIAPDGTIHSSRHAPEGSRMFILKFEKVADAEKSLEWGRIEHAYALMARAGGIEMPETRLIEGVTDDGVRLHNFAVERFDVRPGQTPLHYHSVAGLLNRSISSDDADWGDYSEIADAITAVAPADAPGFERLYRQMVFNVLASNPDDHFKNFGFVHDGRGWRFSPPFDLCFMPPNPGWLGGRSRCSTINNVDDEAIRRPLMVAFGTDNCLLRKSKADSVFDEVAEAVSKWRMHAKAAGVSDSRAEELGGVIDGLLVRSAKGKGRKAAVVADSAGDYEFQNGPESSGRKSARRGREGI